MAPTASAFRDLSKLAPLAYSQGSKSSQKLQNICIPQQTSESPWLELGHMPTLSEASRGTLGWPGITQGHPWSLSTLPFEQNGQSAERGGGDGCGAGHPASGLGILTSKRQPSLISRFPQLVAVRCQASYLTSLSLSLTTCKMGYSSWFRIE